MAGCLSPTRLRTGRNSSPWNSCATTSNAMPKTLYVRLSQGSKGGEDALDRFEAAWHLASGRAAPAPLAVLSFGDLPLLMKTLTPARWELLKRLAKAGPSTIYALAGVLE